jgi:hypothetical protein
MASSAELKSPRMTWRLPAAVLAVGVLAVCGAPVLAEEVRDFPYFWGDVAYETVSLF